MALKRTGTFSATITLGRTNYSDVTLNASLEGRAENLSFNAFSITYGGTPTIANSVILAQVQGAGKANYTLKSISNISDDSVAEVRGAGGGSSIRLKKAGSFTAALVLERNGYFDVTIPAASFTIQKAASKTLGFSKLSIDYKKIISKAELKARITGSDKADYTIQKIDNINPRDAAELTGAGLHIKKTGDFTAKLTLVHAFYGDATVNASFTIQKGNAKNIRFDKLTLPYQATISKARLAQNLKGDKDGYTIQRIDNINPRDAAELTGVGLHIKKAGDFTARLTLVHTFYGDTSVNASFTIQKLPKKTLGFTKFISTYKNLLTRKDILEKVTGQKDGYTIKAISGISDSDVAELTGAGLHIKKAGSFTATLTLGHDIYLDETLTGAAFEIKAYSFSKLVTAYKQTLTKRDIEKQVQELTGYTLKSISVISNTDIAALTGGAAKALHLKKAGSFTATITMEKASNKDIVIPKAEFEIQKLSAQKLSFNALSVSKEYLTQSDILQEVTGAKAGYTLKTISAISGAAMAELSGTGLKIKKAGRFTATLTLEHNIYSDATLTGAAFTIIKLTAPKLSFDKLTLPYQKVVSEQAILQQVKGTKNGYTLKNISEISGISEITGTNIAEFTGTPKAVLHIKKTGSFSAKITLTHPLYKDVEITGAQFEITPKKASAQTLTFKRLVVSKNLITEADILRRITELSGASLENGYTLKALTGLQEVTGGPGLAELSGLSIKIKKTTGIFTATLVLQHPAYLDTTITGATFEKKEQVFIFDEKTRTITGVTAKYKTYFSTATEVTFPDQINGLDVEVIEGRYIPGGGSLNVFSYQKNQTIKTIHWPKNLKTIGRNAFQECSGLTSINVPNSVTTIKEDAFNYCGNIRTITLPAVTTIEFQAFQSCVNLTSVTMPAIKTIGNNAFFSCLKLSSITIGNSLQSIGSSAFHLNMALTSITIPASIKTIGKNLFNLTAKKVVATIRQPEPKQIYAIISTSFDYAKRIEVPKNSVNAYRTANVWKKWKDKIFAMSARKLSFKRLTVSSKTLITEADILSRIPEKEKAGYTIKAISGLQAVSGGPGLVELSGLSIKIKKTAGIFTANLVLTHPEYLDVTLSGATFEKKEPVYVFDEKTQTITGVTAQYKTHFSTAASVTFPDEIDGVEVEVIKGKATPAYTNVFGSTTGNKNIKTIHLPKNLKALEKTALAGTGITSITLPKSVTTLGDYIFSFSDLVSITLHDGITRIGDATFDNCKSLTTVMIPKSVTFIGAGAFGNSPKIIITFKHTHPSQIALGRNVFGTFLASSPTIQQIKVPKGTSSIYKTDILWRQWRSIMVESTD